MEWIYQPEVWPDSEPTQHWFSGRYKITYYPEHHGRDEIRRAFYVAYFKPMGWKNWGNAIKKDGKFFDLLMIHSSKEKIGENMQYGMVNIILIHPNYM